MSDLQPDKILATVAPSYFVGRDSETEALRRHAEGETKSRGLLLLSAPAAGASEILRQTYDQHFRQPGEKIPFYFAVRHSDATAKQCATRFLHTFIMQIIAFRRREVKFLDLPVSFSEFAEAADESDRDWINRLVFACQASIAANDDRAFVRNCLSVPIRAAAHGVQSFLMIDDLHKADSLAGEINFFEELKVHLVGSSACFVLAGRRRYLLGAAQTGETRLTEAEILKVDTLKFTDAGRLTDNLAAELALEINEPSRDLIARQLGGNPTFIRFLLQAAIEKRLPPDSFQRIEQIYTDELFGGKIARFYDAIFQKIAPDSETRTAVIELLYDALFGENKKKPLELWKARTALSNEAFTRMMRALNAQEIVNLSTYLVEAVSDAEVLNDYIRARYRLEIAAENRAAVVGEMMAEFLKRAPRLMAKFYRRSASINLRETLSAFNCQEVPARLFDYSIFKAESENNAEEAGTETETIRLPQIIYTAHTVAYYPALNQVTDETRSAVALGFDERTYTDAGETVWIAAEIDSKLEASKEATEFWCDRLEMVALSCDFTKYKIWLVASEGFSREAIEVLRERDAYGSSGKQVEQLKELLKSENAPAEKTTVSEYEIVVPMDADSELIAAGAVEEIARRHAFEPKAINQIKTALVEACINATEHSLSPDRKIYQKFTVEADKIVITISNRGLRLTDKTAKELKSDEGRGGWGLKLMRSLMDEVNIEQVDDGTRISMTKYNQPEKKQQAQATTN